MKPSKYDSFDQLGSLLKKLKKGSSAPLPPAAPKKPQSVGGAKDDEVFSQAMEDVTPLGWSEVPLPQSKPVEIQNPNQSENEGLRLLKAFVAGKVPFELQFTDEYVEGFPDPDGRFFLKELHEGSFSIQAQLDLHGATSEEARELMDDFLFRSLRHGWGCVKIIHGRGQHSPSGQPVLKEQLQTWLTGRKWGKHILAFTSANLADGGGGAIYVLLTGKIKRRI
jgi:DNA-nicking Smr family endonuclease